jgi:NADPH:quinone reductase-like Zn-dependent oxidoreductase
MSKWPAIVVNESESGRVQQRSEDDLPEGAVTVAVGYSSLNYKDGLAVSSGAVAVLAQLGDPVAASTGRPETRGRVVIDVHG